MIAHPFNAHTCYRCDGEGWDKADDARCKNCKGSGDCTGAICRHTGECERCGWHYSGPRETPTDDGPGEAAHRMAQARRLK